MNKKLMLIVGMASAAFGLEAGPTRSELRLNKQLAAKHEDLANALANFKLRALVPVVTAVGAAKDPKTDSLAHFLKLQQNDSGSWVFEAFDEEAIAKNRELFCSKGIALLDAVASSLRQLKEAEHDKDSIDSLMSSSAGLQGEKGLVFSSEDQDKMAEVSPTSVSAANIVMAVFGRLGQEAEALPKNSTKLWTAEKLKTRKDALVDVADGAFQALRSAPAVISVDGKDVDNPLVKVLRNRLREQMAKKPWLALLIPFKIVWQHFFGKKETPGNLMAKFRSGNLGEISSAATSLRRGATGLSNSLSDNVSFSWLLDDPTPRKRVTSW